MAAARRRKLTIDDFLCDSHTARYQGEFVAHPDATRRLLDVLNDPASDQRLCDAERLGRPALTGIVDVLEGDPAIFDVLASGAAGHRFRQTVGVAVKLKMRTLGWTTTGRKGTVRGAQHFTKAEHYEPPPGAAPDYKARALAGLRAVQAIGDDDERTRTGDELLHNLATTARPNTVRSDVIILLDAGPLGLISHPRPKGLAKRAHDWATARIETGDELRIPEITDYEVRRELVRAERTAGVARLDTLCDALGYEPLTTAVMRDAAALWAEARNAGRPTALDPALDGDVILAAQARALATEQGDEVVVATTNPKHLKRLVDARVWSAI